MPVYLYWGEDDFRLAQAVQVLQDRVLDPTWRSFNYDKLDIATSTEASQQMVQGLNQAMTPPFGCGQRFVWLVNPPLSRQDSDDWLTELERTLPVLPQTSHLLLTHASKPDGRSKATKLLTQYAQIEEFSPIPPWKTDQLAQAVRRAAAQKQVTLTQKALEQLAEAVGNDTRQLYGELEKLKLYASSARSPASTSSISAEVVMRLVVATTHTSLQLADAVRRGNTNQALSLLGELSRQNEPSLRIVATLIRQFRTWLWIKLMVESGERDERVIARAAEVRNPKRIYFLKQDVQSLSANQLRHSISDLLDLEVSLKQGHEAMATLQTHIIQLCLLCGNDTTSYMAPGSRR